MNKFEQVSSYDHQVSLRGGGQTHIWRRPGLGVEVTCLEGGGVSGPCTVRYNESWVMVTLGPPCEQNDGQTRLKTLPSRNFVDGR